MNSAEARRNELERKKQKLAEMRQNKKRMEEERKRQLLTGTPAENGGEVSSSARQTLTNDELSDLLVEVGIEPEPKLNKTPTKSDGTTSENGTSSTLSPRGAQRVAASGARLISLDFTQPQTFANAPRDSAFYSKMTQTDDEKFSIGEFSTGSQEFDYDDDMLPIDKHDVHVDGSPMDDLAEYLPYSFTRSTATVTQPHDEEKKVEEEKPQRLPDLSEEEKHQIMSTPGFLNFFDYSSKVMLRALAEDDIFVNYAIDSAQEVAVSGERLVPSRTFVDEKWTVGRSVVGLSFSEQHPELLAVAYDELREAAGEPTGVVVVWNTKFKKPLPEYVFYCYSRLTSVSFARFHPHLIIGGCYSGQLVLWDNRTGTTKKTPCNKSPLTVSAHTHPVYSLAVVGSANAHNVVSVSTDGKLCAWNIETLAQPVEGKELYGKPSKQVAVLCISFPPNDVNNLIVAGEDGAAYLVARHGSNPADKIFEGHSAPLSGVSFHPSNGPIDFSHIFLTASLDWTVKLWSVKDPKLRVSFEAHSDAVYDVAWSPIHPAVFASVDCTGNLFLWNLNEDIEGPVARLYLNDEETGVATYLRKVVWSANGQSLFVGTSEGEVRMFDVHESMHTNVRPEEWGKFASVLSDVRQAAEEAEEQADALPRSSFVPGSSTAAALVSSPRGATLGY